MAESPAALITRAAELMRERAMAVLAQAGGDPWWNAVGETPALEDHLSREDAEHLAAFSPPMALRLADSWLALAAEMADYPAVLVPLGVGIAYRPGEPSSLWTHTYNAPLEYLREAPGA